MNGFLKKLEEKKVERDNDPQVRATDVSNQAVQEMMALIDRNDVGPRVSDYDDLGDGRSNNAAFQVGGEKNRLRVMGMDSEWSTGQDNAKMAYADGRYTVPTGRGGFVQTEVAFLEAARSRQANDQGARLDGATNWLSGSKTFAQQNEHRSDDYTIRLGASAGAGAGGRMHWSDDDGDGVREFGVGADVGWFSADLKWENLFDHSVTDTVRREAGELVDANGD